MATYKVIQDIEAEDKLLGPLTLRQFIFAGIALTCAYLQFLFLTKGMPFMILFFLPPMLIFGFLAWPFNRDQPTDVWLFSRIRFMFKPRKRIWDQSGAKELVTITAPKTEEKQYTDGLSQGEVKSRLKALANTIDSRGWAVKNVNVNLSAQPQALQSSDRLIMPNVPQEVDNNMVGLADDILDERNNPTAQNLDRLISAKASAHKQQLVQKLKQPVEPAGQAQPQADYWFMNQNSAPIPAGKAVFDTGATIMPEADQPTTQQSQPAPTPVSQANMRTIMPLSDAQSGVLPTPVAQQPPTSSGKTPDPAILELANNDDLNVATIARQANKNQAKDLGDDQVVSLH